MVRAFLIGCAVLFMVVGCAGVRSEAPQKEEQGHTEATKNQAHSDRCEGTHTFRIKAWGVYTTNDVPGCPNGGLLSGTDGRDKLDGQDGEDEIRGLGDKDGLNGGNGADVIYGGPGDDGLRGDTVDNDVGDDGSKDVLYGGPGKDWIDGAKGGDVIYGGEGDDEILWGGAGEDVIYGGDGNDILDPDPRGDGDRDKLYCGKGRDRYNADKLDYVDSSCEKEAEPPPGPGGPFAVQIPKMFLARGSLLRERNLGAADRTLHAAVRRGIGPGLCRILHTNLRAPAMLADL